jgi:hypothetical protein
MMSTNSATISEFMPPSSQSKIITLDEVLQAVNNWRANKLARNEPMPSHIWQDIFTLLNKFSEATICAALDIPKAQLRHKLEESHPPSLSASLSAKPAPPPKIDFCEVKQTPLPITAPASLYKPAKIPATHTLVVEFCRADGRIMKIHTTTESFSDLMKAFFSGV